MSNTGNVSLAWNASIEDDAIMVYDCETKNAMQLTGYKSRIETLLPASYNLTTDTGFTIEAFVWKYVCPPNRDALASSLAPSSENKINLCSLTQPCPIQQCLSSTVTQHTVQTWGHPWKIKLSSDPSPTPNQIHPGNEGAHTGLRFGKGFKLGVENHPQDLRCISILFTISLVWTTGIPQGLGLEKTIRLIWAIRTELHHISKLSQFFLHYMQNCRPPHKPCRADDSLATLLASLIAPQAAPTNGTLIGSWGVTSQRWKVFWTNAGEVPCPASCGVLPGPGWLNLNGTPGPKSIPGGTPVGSGSLSIPPACSTVGFFTRWWQWQFAGPFGISFWPVGHRLREEGFWLLNQQTTSVPSQSSREGIDVCNFPAISNFCNLPQFSATFLQFPQFFHYFFLSFIFPREPEMEGRMRKKPGPTRNFLKLKLFPSKIEEKTYKKNGPEFAKFW